MGHRLFVLTLGILALSCQGGVPHGGSHYQAAVSDAGLVRGPYLQVGTPTSAIVRWRTITATESRVNLGTTPGALSTIVDVATLTTEHEVPLQGLHPGTRYYYSVGTSTKEVASATADQFFITPPVHGTQRPVRIWAIGDSGLGNEDAFRVRDAYRVLTGGMTTYTDIWLMLGDNAYPEGEDESYQRAVFETYPMFLRQSFVWPTIGNHDTAEDPNRPANQIAYLDIFTLPTAGEAGGLPSGTERYYSFDFADVHFICLDSMTSDRKPGGAMLTWLEADLKATTRNWIIAFWHHPPYSKGNHDSDYQPELVEMRQWALPILESHGVDLVLSGHSHTYERTFLLDGHYGLSPTFQESMKKQPGNGRAAEGAAYHKPTTGKAAHEGAVYVVAGNASRVNAVAPHPAVFLSLSQLGSLVVDINGTRLDARLLRDTRFIQDSFTILKGPQDNQLPRVRMTGPPDGSTATSSHVPLAAMAEDPDGTISRVEFYLDTVTFIGRDETPPFEWDWRAIEGVHQISAMATDNRGASVTSMPITVLVPPGVGIPLGPPPPPPPDAASPEETYDAEPDDATGGESAPSDAAVEAPAADAAVDAPLGPDAGRAAGVGWRRGGQAGGSAVACRLSGEGAQPGWPLFLVLGALAHGLRRHRHRP